MAISDYSTTAASNTAISGIDITGTTGLVKNGDNAIRQLMADIKSGVPFISGTAVAVPTGTANFNPDANDGAALGASGTAWSDLFLATGAVANFGAGDITWTHSSGKVTSSGNFEVGPFSISGAGAGKLIQPSTIASSRGDTTSVQHLSFYNPNGQVGSINTNASATAYNTSSDQYFKTNYRDFDAGAIIDKLVLYHFDWIAGGEGYGVKAQEAYVVFPDAISPGSADELYGTDEYERWSADYSKYVSLLLREVQELRKRVAALE